MSAVPAGLRSFQFGPYPALPCRATDCFVPSELNHQCPVMNSNLLPTKPQARRAVTSLNLARPTKDEYLPLNPEGMK